MTSHWLNTPLFTKVLCSWTLGLIVISIILQTRATNSSEDPSTIRTNHSQFNKHKNYSKISPKNDNLEELSDLRNMILDEEPRKENGTQKHNGSISALPRNNSLEEHSVTRNMILDEDPRKENGTQNHNGSIAPIIHFRKSDHSGKHTTIDDSYNQNQNPPAPIDWMRIPEIPQKEMITISVSKSLINEVFEARSTNDTHGSVRASDDLDEELLNLTQTRADKKNNMSCWSCSSLVIRLCRDLQLYGLPKSWEKELWDDCASGYCGYYEWTLDYGEGIKIVQRECVEDDPARFCETKKAILRFINTTVFNNCSTCKGNLCNKQNPVHTASQSCIHVLFAAFFVLQYKFWAR